MIIEAAGVGGRSAVTQQQSPGRTFGLGLGDGLLQWHLAVRAEPHMAVRVDQSGDDPAAVPDRLGPGDRVGMQDTVDDPPLGGLAVRQTEATDV